MHLVDSHAELQRVADALADAPALYLDTEFESQRGGTTLCVLQVSDGEQVHLVDALRLANLAPLVGILNDAGREWVLHAGQQDVPLLIDSLGVQARPKIFDTQIAWALTSAEHSVSLAYLEFRLLGLRKTKAHQADDWKRRPLPASQLAYAAEDVAHLPALHAELQRRLAEHGRPDAAHAASADLLWPETDPPEPLSLSDFRNAWQLDAHCQAALRFAIDWYNALSDEERAFAPEPKVLLSIASRLPQSARDLERIKGVPRRWAERHGDRFTGQLMRATAEADTEGFVPIDPPPYATFEEILLDAWIARARAELCAALCIAPELLLPSRLVKRLRAALLNGDADPVGSTLRGWRADLLAARLRAWMAENPPPRR